MNEDKGNPYWRAFLIDLDLAFKEEHTEGCGATRKTGTKVFMSNGALKDNKDKNHGFTDDLESFFGFCSGSAFITLGQMILVSLAVMDGFEEWNYMKTDALATIKLAP
jgi:hypothetical protein